MKESTKEWLGIKPADLVLYAGFFQLVPVYYSNNQIIDMSLTVIGFILCLLSCWLGMRPHLELNKTNNIIKVIAYPACTLFYIYLVYLSFTAW